MIIWDQFLGATPTLSSPLLCLFLIDNHDMQGSPPLSGLCVMMMNAQQNVDLNVLFC